MSLVAHCRFLPGKAGPENWMAVFLLALLVPSASFACCGAFIATDKAKEAPVSRAAHVVIASDAGRTVMTLAREIEGSAEDIALLIPVPGSLTSAQIRTTNGAALQALENFTAPRLAEAKDASPCTGASADKTDEKTLPLRQELVFANAAYDFTVIPAAESTGLISKLAGMHYALPVTAQKMLARYAQQNMAFLLARIRHVDTGNGWHALLPPIQIAYNSAALALPIRLGLLNAPHSEKPMPVAGYLKEQNNAGPVVRSTEGSRENNNDDRQDLIITLLTRHGRVEPLNARMLALRSERELPGFIRDDFAGFYDAMLRRRAEAEGGVLFLEYAGEVKNASPALDDATLKALGVSWLTAPAEAKAVPSDQESRLAAMRAKIPGAAGNPGNLLAGSMLPARAGVAGPFGRGGGPAPSAPATIDANGHDVFVTRLHARVDAQNFPDDLQFRITDNREGKLARFTTLAAFTGESGDACAATLQRYRQSMPTRYALAAETLARMTGWNAAGIKARMAGSQQAPDNTALPPDTSPWWKDLWQDKP